MELTFGKFILWLIGLPVRLAMFFLLGIVLVGFTALLTMKWEKGTDPYDIWQDSKKMIWPFESLTATKNRKMFNHINQYVSENPVDYKKYAEI